MKLGTAALIVALSMVSLSACKSSKGASKGDLCASFIDKSTDNAIQLAKVFAAKMPPAQAKGMAQKIRDSAKAKRPEMLKKCAAMVAKDPSTAKIMKCVVAAKDLKATAACDPDKKLTAMK